MNATTIKLNVPSTDDGLFYATPIVAATYDTETHELDITEDNNVRYKTLDEVLGSIKALYEANPEVDFDWLLDDRFALKERVPRNKHTEGDLDKLQELFDAYTNAKATGLTVTGLTDLVRWHYEQACAAYLIGPCIPEKV